ncbi:hypothetical protein GCM10027073_38250 [Streptomyces chlorus]
MAYSPRSMASRRWERTASIALTRRAPTPPVWLSDRFTGVMVRGGREGCQAGRTAPALGLPTLSFRGPTSFCGEASVHILTYMANPTVLNPTMFTETPAARTREKGSDFAELGIPYCRTGLFASYATALRHLRSVGEPLREAR